MATLTYPGVYVVEEPSGVRPIAGASTSIGMFVGRTQKGPINVPTRLVNFTEFTRVFGNDHAVSDMARYVRMFFLNGGSDTYIMRIANGATNATVTLLNEATPAVAVLSLTAKSAGAMGEQVRVRVTYPSEEPEARFNMEIWRWGPNAAGVMGASDVEVFQNLTMDANDALYAPDFLSQESAHITAQDLGDPVADAQPGSSVSGRYLFRNSRSAAQDSLATVFDPTPGTPGGTHLRVSVDGLPYVTIDLGDRGPAIAAIVAGTVDALYDAEVFAVIRQRIMDAYTAIGHPGVTVTVSLQNGGDVTGNSTGFLQITSDGTGDIKVRQATQGKDLSIPLMMGPANGGIEEGAHGHRRPAPNGMQVRLGSFAQYNAFAFAPNSTVASVTLTGLDDTGAPVALPAIDVHWRRVLRAVTPWCLIPTGPPCQRIQTGCANG